MYVNKVWCMNSVTLGSHCSANLEFLMVKCRPFYLPREFTSTIITAAYVPTNANAKLATNELHSAISKQQNDHPEAAFIVAGDFNHSNVKTVLPKFHQHISGHTSGNKILDHIYTNMAAAFPATPSPTSDSQITSLCSSHQNTPHQPCQANSEDHQGVASGDRLCTPGQVSTHGVEYVCFPGHLWLTHGH